MHQTPTLVGSSDNLTSKAKGVIIPGGGSHAAQVSFELNHKEYGLPHSSLVKPIDIQFHPSEYGILNNYVVVKEIYRVQLSPTIITLTTHKENNLVSRICPL